jgi:hypothetical protein
MIDEGMFGQRRITPRERWGIAALIAAAVLIFGTLVYHMIHDFPGADYSTHLRIALEMVEQGKFASTHILYQLLVLALIQVPPVSLEAAGTIAATAFYVLTALILYLLLRNVVKGRGSIVVAGVVALALLLATPITLLTASASNFYFGYVEFNTAHNPTIVMLKPIALLLFAFTVSVVSGSTRLSARSLGIGILLVFLSLIAKPNFALILLPVLLAVAAYRLYRRDIDNLKAVLIVLVLPMIVLLAMQYVLMYVFVDTSGSGIAFAPLASVRLFEDSIRKLGIKFVLSLAFPLAVYVLYLRQARRDLPLNLGWLLFLAGAAQMYLLIEQGDRAEHGNFWWSAQIGLFVLFVVSALFWLRHFRDQPRWRGWVCLAVFALHLISGLILYTVQLQANSTITWW